MKIHLSFRTYLVIGFLALFSFGLWSITSTPVRQKAVSPPLEISSALKTELLQSAPAQRPVINTAAPTNKLAKRTIPKPPPAKSGIPPQIATDHTRAAGQQILTRFKTMKERLANQPSKPLNGLARGSGSHVPNPTQQKAIDALLETLGEEAELDMDNVLGTLRYLHGDLHKVIAHSENYQDALSQRDYGQMSIALADELKTVMNVQDPSREFVPQSITEDDLGMVHVKLQQMYQGVPVWGAQTGVHFDADKNPVQISGVYAPSPVGMPEVTGNIDETSAIQEARRTVQATGPDFMPPKVERTIYWDVDRAPVMTYQVELTPSIAQHWHVFVSMNTGQVVHTSKDICAAATVGSAQGLSGQTRAVNSWEQDGAFYLVDTTKPMYSPSSQPPNIDNTKGAVIVLDAKNEVIGNNMVLNIVSSNQQDQWDPTAVTVQYNFGLVEDYFRQTFSRNSIDDEGMNILAIIHARFSGPDGSVSQDNAFWNPGAQLMVFGDGQDAFRNLPASLDVTGHELTHGVINHTANLIYENQSGALNEHLADFYGAMIDRDEWLLGDGIMVHGEALRDMKNPHNANISSQQPMTMSEYRNLPNTPDGDNGGVHVNSGIPNHASYLLAEGPNGIGRDKTERILYRALTQNYLTQRSDFLDYRRAVIASARDLYGENSAEEEAAKKAFDAVEIFDGGETQQAPTQGQTVQGDELAIFLLADPSAGMDDTHEDYYYKLALNNSQNQNLLLAPRYVLQTRPAVSGDGKWVLYVDTDNNIYWTDGESEDQWTDNNIIRSIAMSKDQQYIVFTSVYYDSLITVIDTVNDNVVQAELTIPQMDGPPTALDFADIMSFNFQGDSLIYDAASIKKLENGDNYIVWGIYSMRMVDFVSQQMFAQAYGEQIGNPILAHTSGHHLLCDLELEDEEGPVMGMIAIDILNQKISALFSLNDFSHPAFRGDDEHFLWRGKNSEGGYALLEDRLAEDKLTLVPNSERLLYENNAPIAYPIGFRVGEYVAQAGKLDAPAVLTFGSAAVNSLKQQTITVSNTGNADLQIIDLAIEGENQDSFTHNGINQVITAGKQISFNVDFVPSKEGTIGATLRIQSTAGGQPEAIVQLSGTGTAAEPTPTPVPAQPTPIPPTPVVEPEGTTVPADAIIPIAIFEFDQPTLAENGWTVIPGGFAGAEPGTVEPAALEAGEIPSSIDGKGLKITTGPSEIAFTYAQTAVSTGGHPVLVRMSVRADNPNASVFLVGFKGDLTTFQNVDGSLAYNYTVSAASLVDGERILVLVYEPDTGETITPIVQVASTADSGETTITIDKLEIYQLDPLMNYSGKLFNSKP